MPANKVAVATVLGAVGAIALGVLSPAMAVAAQPNHGGHGDDHATPNIGQYQPPLAPARGKSVYLIADLDGKQEVQTPGKQVGDPDARAQALVEVKGDRITFAVSWKNTSQLTLAHIHEGVAGKEGGVKATMWGTPMPETVTSAAGQVIVDPALAAQIVKSPASFYVNLHSTEFKDGAARGQLKVLNKRVNPLAIIKPGKLRAFANGKQEVPEPGKKVGDPDGAAIGFAQPQGTSVNFSAAWVNIQPPTIMHGHQGVFGKPGPVVITYVATPIPAGIFAVSGTVPNVDKKVLDDLKRAPKAFYLNIHTPDFKDGAVRGQYFG